ncbi:MAG: NAD(P)/FAD-dependent oxidoreductase, partial [Litorilinea sp.]
MPTQREEMVADVIVVGAGPAGSTAAAILARHGLEVLLVDREQFPRDKACGDVVPLGCFLELEKIGLATADMARFHIRQIRLEGSQGAGRAFGLTERATAEGRLGTCVVSRLVFDQALLQHALACGATYCALNVKGPRFDEAGRVIGVTGTRANQTVDYQSALVIGADGATSAMARALDHTQKRDSQWAVALRGYVDTEVALAETIELAFLDEIQPGYAWFFPVSERRANVGVGMRTDYYKRHGRDLSQLLEDYLARPELASRIGLHRVEDAQSWPVPFFSFDKQRVFDGALLAGDAGGFVHPITAAGIYPAIMTGKAAAETAIDALAHGDVTQAGLAGYTARWEDALA